MPGSSGAEEGAQYNMRANVVGPSFVRTPLADKQIPEQAKEPASRSSSAMVGLWIRQHAHRGDC